MCVCVCSCQLRNDPKLARVNQGVTRTISLRPNIWTRKKNQIFVHYSNTLLFQKHAQKYLKSVFSLYLINQRRLDVAWTGGTEFHFRSTPGDVSGGLFCFQRCFRSLNQAKPELVGFQLQLWCECKNHQSLSLVKAHL